MDDAHTKAQMLNEKEVAARWSISPRTLQAWRLKGGGPRFVRLGRAVRYMVQELEQWVANQTKQSTAEA